MKPELSTTYLGLKLDNPFVASASPMTGNVDSLLNLQKAGASATVLPSLFEEQIEHERTEVKRLHPFHSQSSAESPSHVPEKYLYNIGSDQYMQLIRDAKDKLDIPIIASLNGATVGGWVYYAHLMQQSGADAIELNIYSIPTNPAETSDNVERHYRDLIAAVRSKISVPLAIKIGPFFSSMPYIAGGFVNAGADALVLFNRYLAPDVDLESLTFEPSLKLSESEELRLALRWIAILRDQVSISLAASGGVHSGLDAAKALLVGADAVLLASALLTEGPETLLRMREELAAWMTTRQYKSVDRFKGSMSLQNCANPEGLERANYMKALTSYVATTR